MGTILTILYLFCCHLCVVTLQLSDGVCKRMEDNNATLNNEQLVRLLLRNCSDNVQNGIERVNDRTNDKLEIVINGLCREISIAVNALRSTHEEKISNLELKLDTVTTYLEQQLYSQNVSTKHRNNSNYHCNSCGDNFPSIRELFYHQCLTNLKLALTCKNCEKSFQSKSELAAHIENAHASYNGPQCHAGEENSSPSCEIEDYLITSHRLNQHSTTSCDTCEIVFPSLDILATHTSNLHRTNHHDDSVC